MLGQLLQLLQPARVHPEVLPGLCRRGGGVGRGSTAVQHSRLPLRWLRPRLLPAATQEVLLPLPAPLASLLCLLLLPRIPACLVRVSCCCSSCERACCAWTGPLRLWRSGLSSSHRWHLLLRHLLPLRLPSGRRRWRRRHILRVA